MEMKSFFGERGLTSTLANHIAELASHYADEAKNAIASTSFVTESVIIPGLEPILISAGMSRQQFSESVESLKKVAQCNSLIAFFREAIKEKERLTNEAGAWQDEERRLAYNQKADALVKPKLRPTISKEDVIRGWSIGQQEHYLTLQATCSVYGKYIHQDGALDYARKRLLEKIAHPRTVSGEGRDITVTEYTPSLAFDEVDHMYQDLQGVWRNTQAELNGLNKQIENAIKADAKQKADAYRIELAQYEECRSQLSHELELIIADENAERTRLLEEVQKLKIVVPNHFESLISELNSIG